MSGILPVLDENEGEHHVDYLRSWRKWGYWEVSGSSSSVGTVVSLITPGVIGWAWFTEIELYVSLRLQSQPRHLHPFFCILRLDHDNNARRK
jgi:hypothetical protein